MVLPPSPSRKPRSAAVQELWHAYDDWRMALETPDRDDEDVDDSWERFLRDRRKSKEKERLRLFELKRNAALKEQRRVARLQEPAIEPAEKQPTAGQQRWAVQAEQRMQDYFDWLETIPTAKRDDRKRRDDSLEAFMRHRRTVQQEQYNDARRKGTKRGRPVDHNSQRQQQRCRRTVRSYKREHAHRLWKPRYEELAALGITTFSKVSRSTKAGYYNIRYFDVPTGVKPPEWMLAQTYRGFPWRMYDRPDHSRDADVNPQRRLIK